MTPTSESEVAHLLSTSNNAFAIQGGGSRGLQTEIDQQTISLEMLNGIECYEPSTLTMIVKAGTPLSHIESVLENKRQMLPFEPPNFQKLINNNGNTTIGGVVATNASGPRRFQKGACRDYLLGVRFVSGTGHILKSGGRVMKNVTGYDLAKLICGSYGTLGILTEVAIKVLPMPEVMANIVIENLPMQEAVRAMTYARTLPYEITGAAYLPESDSPRSETLLRVEGFRESVSYRSEALRKKLCHYGQVTITRDLTIAKNKWQDICDVAPFVKKDGNVWRLSVKATDSPEIVSNLQNSCNIEYYLDWSGGLIWVLAPEGYDIRPLIDRFQCNAMLTRADCETRSNIATFHPQPFALADITKRLKDKFDPRGILNPGIVLHGNP